MYLLLDRVARTVTGSVTVPLIAVPGNTAMRVVLLKPVHLFLVVLIHGAKPKII